jgi:hypothetical protein
MPALLSAVCLVLATVAVHVPGLYITIRPLQDVGARQLNRGSHVFLQVVVVLTLYIVTLHMIEVVIWAAFYRAVVGFDDWPTAVSFSLGCYTTVGVDQVVLPRQWGLLKGLEAITAALMFGLSTAFIFAVINESHRRWRQFEAQRASTPVTNYE